MSSTSRCFHFRTGMTVKKRSQTFFKSTGIACLVLVSHRYEKYYSSSSCHSLATQLPMSPLRMDMKKFAGICDFKPAFLKTPVTV